VNGVEPEGLVVRPRPVAGVVLPGVVVVVRRDVPREVFNLQICVVNSRIVIAVDAGGRVDA